MCFSSTRFSNVSFLPDQRYFSTIGKYFRPDGSSCVWKWSSKHFSVQERVFLQMNFLFFTLIYHTSHWWWWSLPAVSSRAASEACDGLRWVWTLWHWKTEGLDFWEERSIWIELCSHPPKNIQIFSHKKMDDETRDIWDFHQIDFACQDLADTSFYWKWRDGALRGPFDPSKFSRTLAEMWHPLKAAIPQYQNHQKRFHPCGEAIMFLSFLPISSCERFWDWCTWVVVFI